MPSKKKENVKEGWTTMYVPKNTVPHLVDDLMELVIADLPSGVQMPKYAVMELALKEAIAKRSKGSPRK
tara:strand:- start:3 stop:209 length:207 start_codon:yes stop_codon:yes gene_type:complete